METSISKTNAAPILPRQEQAISEVPLKEKSVSGTFRYEKDDIQPGLPGLSPLSGPVLGGQIRKNDPGQTGNDRVQLSHCPRCSGAGFGPMTEWEDPRYIALRNLAIIRNQNKLSNGEMASLDPAIRVLTRSVFRDERLKAEARF